MALETHWIAFSPSPVSQPPTDVTQLLQSLSSGNRQAFDELVETVYEKLRQIAASQLRKERRNATIGTTALVNEAYESLANQKVASWTNRNHFFAVAATCMRRILTDRARRRLAQKRGGGAVFQTFDDNLVGVDNDERLVALDEALDLLAKTNERQSRVVEYRFYVGLKYDEIAEVLEVSSETVKRDWRFARAWLSRELGKLDG